MPSHAENFLMYSPTLGQVDMEWKWRWHIGGYCFNDDFPYEEAALQSFMDFVNKDDRKTLFFTLGSCNERKRDRVAEFLEEICLTNNYKLVIGCGWWKVGMRLDKRENLFLLDKAVPHRLIFPHCDAVIHHGGSGTTHSASRAGKPQLVAPLILDQFYWAYRVRDLNMGPGAFNIGTISKKKLERYVRDLMDNPAYQENARAVGEKMNRENGLDALCDFVERVHSAQSVPHERRSDIFPAAMYPGMRRFSKSSS
jgi:UDP:flavonoid glycosyltransferase YjiC (YdhE family)